MQEHGEERKKSSMPFALLTGPLIVPDGDWGHLDSVPAGTGERKGPLYRCLMVTTGKEVEVLELLQALRLCRPVMPMKVRLRRFRGEWREDEVPMLPGYLFVHEENEIPIWKYQQLIDVLKVLRYDREPYGYMRERDLRFVQTVFEMEGRIAPLKAVQEGDFVRITDGLLENLNGKVLSVDRHKRQARIRIELMGMSKVIFMNYRLLEKAEEPMEGGSVGFSGEHSLSHFQGKDLRIDDLDEEG